MTADESDMKFLDEVGARKAIQELLKSTTEAKIAVPFWGAGAAEALGLGRPELRLEIVCNLDSGACNPHEIRKIQGLGDHVSVRSDPRLHGKVYWTPTAVVLGSSNASTNGLAVEGGALSGWAEANVLSQDAGLIESTRTWFEGRRASAYEIGDEDLKRAEILWNMRAKAASPGLSLRADLLQAFRSSRDHPAWRRVKLALWSEGLSRAGERALQDGPRTAPSFKGLDVYEAWHNELKGGDWLLDFALEDHAATFTGYWEVPDPKLETDLVTYVRKQTALLLSGFGALKLSTDDLKRLRQEVRPLLQHTEPGAKNAIIPLADAVEFLDQSPPARPSASTAPDTAAFKRAMMAIYEEAAAIGYRPHAFREMLHDIGAVETAKRLINSANPSPGFTRLWELKRLDLTVESLVLLAPWRGLFTADELDRAQRRLKQFGHASEAQPL